MYIHIVDGTKSSLCQKTMSWSNLFANVFVGTFNGDEGKQLHGIYTNT